MSDHTIRKIEDIIGNFNQYATKKRGYDHKTLGVADLKKKMGKDEACTFAMESYNALMAARNLIYKLSKQVEDSASNLEVVDQLKQEIDDLTTKNEELETGANLFTIEDFKTTVKDCLPQIVKEVVKETTHSNKWTNLFKTQMKEELNKEMESCFQKTISTELQKNQASLLQKATAKQDLDFYERDRRTRNVVISNIKELTTDVTQDRISYDNQAAATILGLELSDIVNSKRIGDAPGVGRNKEKKQRILIVHLKEPQEATRLHNYGLGKKVPADNDDLAALVVPTEDCFWVNPDLTKTERIAAYEARKQRNLRRNNTNNTQAQTFQNVEGE